MKRLVLEGDMAYALGPNQITLKIGKICNHGIDRDSEALLIRFYALEESSSGGVRGHVVAEAKLPSLQSGAEVADYESKIPIAFQPEGYFLPAIALLEKISSAPDGWAIVDMERFDAPHYFGVPIKFGDVEIKSEGESILVSIEKLINQKRTPTGEIRLTFMLTNEAYTSGAVRGLKLGTQDVDVIAENHYGGPYEFKFRYPNDAADRSHILIFLEELCENKWVPQNHYSAACGVATQAERARQAAVEEFDPMDELQSLIGLESVKKEMRDLNAWAEWVSDLRKHGREKIEDRNLHMCFVGSPGTGKTTVARIIGRMLNKYNLLPKDTFIEATRADLVANYIGQTASKTQEVIDEALGGVLFIDEAYSLSEASAGGSSKFFGQSIHGIRVSGLRTQIRLLNDLFQICLAQQTHAQDGVSFLYVRFDSKSF